MGVWVGGAWLSSLRIPWGFRIRELCWGLGAGGFLGERGGRDFSGRGDCSRSGDFSGSGAFRGYSGLRAASGRSPCRWAGGGLMAVASAVAAPAPRRLRPAALGRTSRRRIAGSGFVRGGREFSARLRSVPGDARGNHRGRPVGTRTGRPAARTALSRFRGFPRAQQGRERRGGALWGRVLGRAAPRWPAFPCREPSPLVDPCWERVRGNERGGRRARSRDQRKGTKSPACTMPSSSPTVKKPVTENSWISSAV